MDKYRHCHLLKRVQSQQCCSDWANEFFLSVGMVNLSLAVTQIYRFLIHSWYIKYKYVKIIQGIILSNKYVKEYKRSLHSYSFNYRFFSHSLLWMEQNWMCSPKNRKTTQNQSSKNKIKSHPWKNTTNVFYWISYSFKLFYNFYIPHTLIWLCSLVRKLPGQWFLSLASQQFENWSKKGESMSSFLYPQRRLRDLNLKSLKISLSYTGVLKGVK